MNEEKYGKKQKKLPYDDDDFFENGSVSSASDCTGLIPSAPVSESEAESYAQLMEIPNPQKKHGRGAARDGK
jgi:hypothetical protein